MADTIDYYANKADVPQGTLVELFFRTVNRLADNPAYNVTGTGARTYTYGQVRDVVRRGAAALARSGVGRGERAAILSENRAEWALADWSCVCAGVVDVPIYSTLPAAQVAYILKDCGASLVFVSDAEQLAKAREAAADLGLHLFAELVDSGFELIALQPFLQRGQLLGSVLAGLTHKALQNSVEIEVSQCAVQVVGAPHWATGLHAGVALYRLSGDGPHKSIVAPHERLEQHFGELFSRHGLAASPTLAALLAVQPVYEVGQVHTLGPLAIYQVVLGPPQ